MPSYTKISIYLKDSASHNDYNQRIMEYLSDRHTALNDNMYTIAITPVDDMNINDCVLNGIESIPALQVAKTEEFVYGVNSIMAMLAKLEILQSDDSAHGNASTHNKKNSMKNELADTHENADGGGPSFYELSLLEMQSDEQEDPDKASTIRTHGQDLPETRLSDRAIEEKVKAYSQIYDDRSRKASRQGRGAPPPQAKTTKSNVDNVIKAEGYDKGEALLMRQIAESM